MPLHPLQAQQEVKKLTGKLQNKELEAQPGMTMLETFESNVNQVPYKLSVFSSVELSV